MRDAWTIYEEIEDTEEINYLPDIIFVGLALIAALTTLALML